MAPNLGCVPIAACFCKELTGTLFPLQRNALQQLLNNTGKPLSCDPGRL